MATYATWKDVPMQTWQQQRLAVIKAIPTSRWIAFFLVLALLNALKLKFAIEEGTAIAFLGTLPIYFLVGWAFLTVGNETLPSSDLLKKSASEQQPFSAVKVTIFKDDYPIGEDEGLVFFTESELVYEGLRTAFKLSSLDVDAPIEKFANGPLIRDTAEQHKFGNLDGKAAWGFCLRERP